MEYITLNNGIKMPLVGFGTWDLRGEACMQAVKEAIDVGYRLIDTARMYNNEKAVGQALKQGKVPREQLFITTKLYSPSTSYHQTKKDIEDSLKNLQLDYIDLLLIHEPYTQSLEMYQAMKEAYQEGKIKAIGISNFHQENYLHFVENCGILPAINQVEAHVFFQQDKLHQMVLQDGCHLEAWSPLTAGKKDIFHHPVLLDIARQYQKTVAQIVLKFFVQQNIVVIPKTSHRERMVENIDLFDFQLDNQTIQKIKDLDQDQTLFGWY